MAKQAQCGQGEVMKLEDIKPQMRVAYVPRHAKGNANHPDVERGTVSSTNAIYAFVKFDKQLKEFGWDSTTSKACPPGELIPL